MTAEPKLVWSRQALAGAQSLERKFIPVNLLDIGPAYQRHLREDPSAEDFQRYLRENWDDRRVGMLRVTPAKPDGHHDVIDGGNRTIVARSLGIGVLFCQIDPPETVEEQAIEFYHQRDRRALKTDDYFRAKRVARDPTVLHICEIAENAGYHLPDGHGPDGMRMKATGALQAIYRHGAAEFELLIRLLSRQWRGRDGAIEGQMMRGLSMFLRAYLPKAVFRIDRLERVLSDTPPAEVLAAARAIAIATGRAGATNGYAPYVLAFRDFYNKGLTPKNRLPWPELNDRRLPPHGRGPR